MVGFRVGDGSDRTDTGVADMPNWPQNGSGQTYGDTGKELSGDDMWIVPDGFFCLM
jgi:hypothetical protein